MSVYVKTDKGMKLQSVKFLDYKGKTRKPLRTLLEMAEEFGLAPKSLAQYIKNRGGPEAKMLTRRSDVRNVWYEPGELRAWWAQQPESAPIDSR